MYMASRLFNVVLLIAATLGAAGCSNLEGFLPLKKVDTQSQMRNPGLPGNCKILNPLPGTCSCPVGEFYEPRTKRCREEIPSSFSVSSPSSRVQVRSTMQTDVEGSCDGSAIISARGTVSTSGSDALTGVPTTSCSNSRFRLRLNFSEAAASKTVDIVVSQGPAQNYRESQPTSINYWINNATLPQGVLSFTDPQPVTSQPWPQITFGQSYLFRGSCHAPSQHNLRLRAASGSGVNFDQTMTIPCAAQNQTNEQDAWSHSVMLPAHVSAYDVDAILSPIPNATSPQVQIPVSTQMTVRVIAAAPSQFTMSSPVSADPMPVLRYGQALDVVGSCDALQRVNVVLFRIPDSDEDSLGIDSTSDLLFSAQLRGEENDSGAASSEKQSVPGNNTSDMTSALNNSSTGEGAGLFSSFSVASSGQSTNTPELKDGASSSRQNNQNTFEINRPVDQLEGLDGGRVEIANRSLICQAAPGGGPASYRFSFAMTGYSGVLLVEASQTRAPLLQNPPRFSALVTYEDAPQDLPSSFQVAQPLNNQRLEMKPFAVMGPCDPGSQVNLLMEPINQSNQTVPISQNLACQNSAFTTTLTPVSTGRHVLSVRQTKATGYLQPGVKTINLDFEAVVPSQLTLVNPTEHQRLSSAIAFSGQCDYLPGQPVQNQQMVNVSLKVNETPSWEQTLSTVPVRCSPSPAGGKLGSFQGSIALQASWSGQFQVWVSANKVFGFQTPALIRRQITIGAPDQVSRLALISPKVDETIRDLNFDGLCDIGSELQLKLDRHDEGPSPKQAVSWTSVKTPCSNSGTFHLRPSDPKLVAGRYKATLRQSKVDGVTEPAVVTRHFSYDQRLLPSQFAMTEPKTGDQVRNSFRVAGRCDPTSKVKIGYLNIPQETGAPAVELGGLEETCVTGDFSNRFEIPTSVQGQIKVVVQQSQVTGTELPQQAVALVQVVDNPLAQSQFKLLSPERDQEAPLESLAFSGTCDLGSEVDVQSSQGESGLWDLTSTRCSESKTWNWSFNPRNQEGLVRFQFSQSQAEGHQAAPTQFRNITFRSRELEPSLFALTSPVDGNQFEDILLVKGSCDPKTKIEFKISESEKPDLVLQTLSLNCSDEKTFNYEWDLAALPKEARELRLNVKQDQLDGTQAPIAVAVKIERVDERRESRFAVANPVDGAILSTNSPITFDGTCDMAESSSSQSGSGRIEVAIQDDKGQNLVENQQLQTVCDKGTFKLIANLKEDFEGEFKAQVNQSQVDGFRPAVPKVLNLKMKRQSLLPSIFTAKVFTESQPSGFLVGTVQQGGTLVWRGLCDQSLTKDEPPAKIQVVVLKRGGSISKPKPVVQSELNADCKDSKEWEVESTTLTSEAGTLSFQASQLLQIPGYEVPSVVSGTVQVLERLSPSLFELIEPIKDKVIRYSNNVIQVPVFLTCDPKSELIMSLSVFNGPKLGEPRKAECSSSKQWSGTLTAELRQPAEKLILEVSQTQVPGSLKPPPAARELRLVEDVAESKLKILKPAPATQVRQNSVLDIKLMCDAGARLSGVLSQTKASLMLQAGECDSSGGFEWRLSIGKTLSPGEARLQIKQAAMESVGSGVDAVVIKIIEGTTPSQPATPKEGLEDLANESRVGGVENDLRQVGQALEF